MSRFQIGQQVRIAYAYTLEGSVYVGRVGTVTEIAEFEDGDLYGLDCTPLEEDEYDGIVWGWHEDQLAPAADLHEASEYTFTELMDRCRAGEVANV